jgi:3-dehydroquinate synthetase
VGHAIEQVTEYTILHGEAVGIGLVAESLLAEQVGVARPGLAEAVRKALIRLGCPVSIEPEWSIDSLLTAMSRDKKVRGDELRFALPSGVGAMAGAEKNWTVPVPAGVVRDVLERSRRLGALVR